MKIVKLTWFVEEWNAYTYAWSYDEEATEETFHQKCLIEIQKGKHYDDVEWGVGDPPFPHADEDFWPDGSEINGRLMWEFPTAESPDAAVLRKWAEMFKTRMLDAGDTSGLIVDLLEDKAHDLEKDKK
tara:strand:- start:2363 stop:2746 length:384 start_codon:yes stop_codon:yes gene_type:complete